MRADEYQTECTDCWGQDWGEEERGEVEIDVVGETCRRCGGLGRYARECPTPKGKSKDASKDGGKAKGKGKGFGNQHGKGINYGGKGGGKGQSKGKGRSFGGERWTCGEKGHQSSECDHGRKADMEIGSVEQEVGVGGVWAIAQVKAEEHWQEVRRAGKRVGFDSRINCVECQPVIEEKNICKVEGKKPWRPIGSGEIMVDSAAEESVCPKTWEGGIQMRRPSRWLRFVKASGGSRWATTARRRRRSAQEGARQSFWCVCLFFFSCFSFSFMFLFFFFNFSCLQFLVFFFQFFFFNCFMCYCFLLVFLFSF